MRSKLTTALVLTTALAAAAAPSVALAKHGADDGPGHKRHARHHVAKTARHGADDRPGDARRGGGRDDGPNHR
jgi:Spy/CpxP family protein refolding chaperone